jgi:cytoskeletal protein RodZ
MDDPSRPLCVIVVLCLSVLLASTSHKKKGELKVDARNEASSKDGRDSDSKEDSDSSTKFKSISIEHEGTNKRSKSKREAPPEVSVASRAGGEHRTSVAKDVAKKPAARKKPAAKKPRRSKTPVTATTTRVTRSNASQMPQSGASGLMDTLPPPKTKAKKSRKGVLCAARVKNEEEQWKLQFNNLCGYNRIHGHYELGGWLLTVYLHLKFSH